MGCVFSMPLHTGKVAGERLLLSQYELGCGSNPALSMRVGALVQRRMAMSASGSFRLTNRAKSTCCLSGNPNEVAAKTAILIARLCFGATATFCRILASKDRLLLRHILDSVSLILFWEDAKLSNSSECSWRESERRVWGKSRV